MLHSNPSELLRLIAKTVCCCCCLPCADVPMVDVSAGNVGQLAARLRDSFGVRNLLVVGPPITVEMPLVARYLQVLLGRGALSTCLGGIAVRRLNALYLTRIHHAVAETGARVVAIDEAREIEAIATGSGDGAAIMAALSAEPSDAVDTDGGSTASDGTRQRLCGPAELWSDMMHPSGRCHAALSVSMLEQFMRAVPAVSAPTLTRAS